MISQICSCKGLNAKCEKCFGSGYMSAETSKKSSEARQPKKEQNQITKVKVKPFLANKVDTLLKSEIENILATIIDSLDLKSKKQMQLLNSIPFNSTTFRRDLKDKFESLRLLENEKRLLRDELDTIAKEMAARKSQNNFKFKHFLSDKDIDVSSNRQLKQLIKEYKKTKK